MGSYTNSVIMYYLKLLHNEFPEVKYRLCDFDCWDEEYLSYLMDIYDRHDNEVVSLKLLNV